MVPVEDRGSRVTPRLISPASLPLATPHPAAYASADAGFAERSYIFLFTDLKSVTNFRTDTHENHSGFPFYPVGRLPERIATLDRLAFDFSVGLFCAIPTRRGSSWRLRYAKLSILMVGCSPPFLHQPKLRGDIHVIPLSNWQADGIRKPPHSPRKFSLVPPQEYPFRGNQEKEGEERKLKFPPRKLPNSEVISSQHETEENQNSRDSGSSSEDGGKKDGS